MLRKTFLIIALFLNTFALAEINLDGDLSGNWQLKVENGGTDKPLLFTLSKTNWAPTAFGKQFSHYIVSAEANSGLHWLMAIMIGKNIDDQYYIYLLAPDYMSHSKLLTLQPSPILGQENDEIIIGENGDNHEFGRMSRVN